MPTVHWKKSCHWLHKLFFAMQIKQFNKKPTGRRFIKDFMSLYKPCPKAYHCLLSEICILRKRRTLDKILEKLNLQ